jgi:hypothetical protein
MKNILPLFFLFLFQYTFGQVNSVLPSEANAFYQNSMNSIKPAVKNLIEKNANKLTGQKVNADSLVKELHKNPLLKNGNEKDLEAIAVLILVQASKNADNELKDIVVHMRNSESEKYKSSATLLLENKSEIADAVAVILKDISGSPEMVMDKFK